MLAVSVYANVTKHVLVAQHEDWSVVATLENRSSVSNLLEWASLMQSLTHRLSVVSGGEFS